jgi:hypothetical protein
LYGDWWTSEDRQSCVQCLLPRHDRAHLSFFVHGQFAADAHTCPVDSSAERQGWALRLAGGWDRESEHPNRSVKKLLS